MSLDDLRPGLRHTQMIMVNETLTVPAVSTVFTGFVDMPAVFATAFMVGFVGWVGIAPLLAKAAFTAVCADLRGYPLIHQRFRSRPYLRHGERQESL